MHLRLKVLYMLQRYTARNTSTHKKNVYQLHFLPDDAAISREKTKLARVMKGIFVVLQ